MMKRMQMGGSSVRSTWKWTGGSVTRLGRGRSRGDLISQTTMPCAHLPVRRSVLVGRPSLGDRKSAWQMLPEPP